MTPLLLFCGMAGRVLSNRTLRGRRTPLIAPCRGSCCACWGRDPNSPRRSHARGVERVLWPAQRRMHGVAIHRGVALVVKILSKPLIERVCAAATPEAACNGPDMAACIWRQHASLGTPPPKRLLFLIQNSRAMAPESEIEGQPSSPSQARAQKGHEPRDPTDPARRVPYPKNRLPSHPFPSIPRLFCLKGRECGTGEPERPGPDGQADVGSWRGGSQWPHSLC